jgi:hypothetical protein
MARNLPPTIIWLGVGSLLLGLAWLLLVLLVRGGDMVDLIRARQDPQLALRLAERGLGTAGAIFVAVPTLLLELVLAVILAVAGVGLLRLWPFARWAALFGCAGGVAVEGLSTLLQVFCLTPSGAAVKLIPVLVNGLVVVAAIVLWGGLFLSEASAAYAAPPGEGTAGPTGPGSEKSQP